MSIMVADTTIEDARRQFEKNLQLEAEQKARGSLYVHEKHAFMTVMEDTEKQRKAQVEHLIKAKSLSRYEGIFNQLAPNLRNFTVPFHLANELILSIPKYEKRKAKIAEMESMKAAVRKQEEKEKEKIAEVKLDKAVAEATKGITKKDAASKKKIQKTRFAKQPKVNTFYTYGDAS